MSDPVEIPQTPPYVSPFGKPAGLPQRLLDACAALGKGRELPWIGTGVIEDLKLAAKILNLTEFAEHLRVNGTPEQQAFADEILADQETLEAAADAGSRIKAEIGVDHSPDDPVDAIETLDKVACAAQEDNRAVRRVLVQIGALEDGDDETPTAGLVKALLL